MTVRVITYPTPRDAWCAATAILLSADRMTVVDRHGATLIIRTRRSGK